MAFPYFTGKRETPVPDPNQFLPKPKKQFLVAPQNYQCTHEMVNAVNVALIMNTDFHAK